jgi:hypothetical protein
MQRPDRENRAGAPLTSTVISMGFELRHEGDRLGVVLPESRHRHAARFREQRVQLVGGSGARMPHAGGVVQRAGEQIPFGLRQHVARCLFVICGGILLGHGIVVGIRVVGVNINLWWGVVMLVSGGLFLGLSARARTR